MVSVVLEPQHVWSRSTWSSAFNPIISIGLNLLANKYIESRMQEFISRVEKDLPGMATDIAKKAIITGVPKPMVIIKPSPAIASLVSILKRNPTRLLCAPAAV